MKHGWMAVLAFSLFACGTVTAAQIELIGARMDIPSEYRVVQKEELRRHGRSFTARQQQKIQVTDAQGQPHDLLVVANYFSMPNIDNAVMEDIVRKGVDETAAKPGNSVSPQRLDGFDFHFIEGPLDAEKTYKHRMMLTGVLNGASYVISILAKEDGVLSPAIANSLKNAKLDYAGMLRLKPAFEDEAKVAVQGNMLDTPLNRLALDSKTQARLISSYLRSDASGEVTHRVRGFGLFKAGFWTLQNLSVAVGCGSAASQDGDPHRDFITMKDGLEEEDADERVAQVSAPAAATLATLAAETATAKGSKVNAYKRSDIRRWSAVHAGQVFQVDVARVNGSPVEKMLIDQLRKAEPRCQSGLQFGAPRAP